LALQQGVTRAAAVRMAIEAEIFSGAMAPGTRIDEATLVKRFKVSRTPVREAILKLTEAGLIEKRSRKQSQVASLDLHRLIQLFETLADLEGLSARYCARRISEDEKRLLLANHLQALAALQAGREDEYAELGVRFHQLILEGSHNEALIEITSRLASRLVPYRRIQGKAPGRWQANQTDHDAIVAAIDKQDAEKAEQVMREHASIQGDRLADFIAHTKSWR
jgi:DNA-binding GntR family transcriptional regulator